MPRPSLPPAPAVPSASLNWTVQPESVTAGVPNAPMQSIDQALAHEQTQALGILQQSPDGKIALIGSPLSLDGVRLPFRLAPPALGAQTAEILGGDAKAETNSDTKTPQKAQA